MRIVFHTSTIEEKMGGATISTLEVLRGLVNRGHEAAVVARNAELKETFGIPVYEEDRPSIIKKFYSWADVVFAMRRAPLQHIKEYERWSVPHGAHPIYTVYFAHNVGQPFKNGYDEGDIDLVVFNARWVKEETGWPGEQIMIHPPIFREKYIVNKTGDRITQINLARKKGGLLFWEIAAALPEMKFLAVLGKEKDQVVPKRPPRNVRIIEYTRDVRSVYEQTGVLLMPSQGYGTQHRWDDGSLSAESYGRVGVEAALSGIPVVAYPTPGIKEALGDEGIYCDMQVKSWVGELEKLSEPDYYRHASEKIKAVGERLNPLADIRDLEQLLLKKAEEAVLTKPKRYKAFFELPLQQRVDRLPPVPRYKRYSISVPDNRYTRFIVRILKRAREMIRSTHDNIYDRADSDQ